MLVNKSESGLTATFAHKTFAECRNFYSWAACSSSSSSSTFDFAACDEALTQAKCVDTEKGKGLEFPASCR